MHCSSAPGPLATLTHTCAPAPAASTPFGYYRCCHHRSPAWPVGLGGCGGASWGQGLQRPPGGPGRQGAAAPRRPPTGGAHRSALPRPGLGSPAGRALAPPQPGSLGSSRRGRDRQSQHAAACPARRVGSPASPGKPPVRRQCCHTAGRRGSHP
uniref:Uncharacterized protein n=1 Tax=Ixodes ricinus TaxID=34613 RepID=A0A147BVC0_IXORI